MDKDLHTLTLNGKKIKRGKDFRTGVYHTLEGSNVNVWIRIKTVKSVTVSFK
jgi:hypothetical protein